MFRSVMLRYVLPIALAACVVAFFGLPYIERLLAEWFRSDVELRAQLVMHSMEERITYLVESGNQLPRNANRRPALACSPGVPSRRFDDIRDWGDARHDFLRCRR
jgi:hypothetical protein